jgi:hypothetical protein
VKHFQGLCNKFEIICTGTRELVWGNYPHQAGSYLTQTDFIYEMFDVFVAVTMKNVFLDVTLCGYCKN